jgi:hypothetical protein
MKPSRIDNTPSVDLSMLEAAGNAAVKRRPPRARSAPNQPTGKNTPDQLKELPARATQLSRNGAQRVTNALRRQTDAGWKVASIRDKQQWPIVPSGPLTVSPQVSNNPPPKLRTAAWRPKPIIKNLPEPQSAIMETPQRAQLGQAPDANRPPPRAVHEPTVNFKSRTHQTLGRNSKTDHRHNGSPPPHVKEAYRRLGLSPKPDWSEVFGVPFRPTILSEAGMASSRPEIETLQDELEQLRTKVADRYDRLRKKHVDVARYGSETPAQREEARVRTAIEIELNTADRSFGKLYDEVTNALDERRAELALASNGKRQS